jgi:hypothetical protein
MHSRNAKIVDLVGKHLQTKEQKNHNERKRAGTESKKKKEKR